MSGSVHGVRALSYLLARNGLLDPFSPIIAQCIALCAIMSRYHIPLSVPGNKGKWDAQPAS